MARGGGARGVDPTAREWLRRTTSPAIVLPTCSSIPSSTTPTPLPATRVAAAAADAGEGFAARVAASTLHAVGLPELIAETPAEYEATALALATEPARLADIRARLGTDLPTKPLFDSARWTRALEFAWTEIVRRHVAGEPVRDCVVDDVAR